MTLPQYRGIMLEYLPNETAMLFDLTVRAFRGDREVIFTVPKQLLFVRGRELYKYIEQQIQPLVDPVYVRLQVDLRVK